MAAKGEHGAFTFLKALDRFGTLKDAKFFDAYPGHC